jgi:hypothetical protein
MKMTIRCAFVFAVLTFTAGVSRAQRSEPGDTWLTQNYHFPGPPPPGEMRPTVPVASELQEIQNTLLAILRKANFAGDYEAALAAAAQATANAQWRLSRGATVDEARPKSAVYLIALKDESIHAATSHWADRTMLHYVTPQGAHEQVRLDLVDRAVTSELNSQRRVAKR